MTQSFLNKRQDIILHFLSLRKSARIREIKDEITEDFPSVSKITINRDLKKLIELNFVVLKGAGRAVTYRLSGSYSTIRPVDIEKYFEKEIDERDINESFNFDVFSNFQVVFTDKEKDYLNRLNKTYLDRVKNLPKDIVKKEFERLTVELSWKSSKIEGNTYSLLETEQLIKDHKETKNHTKEEAVMILGHKKALDSIRSHTSSFERLSLKKIEEIHSILTDGLGISKNVRNSLVGITGTRYKPLDNKFQITEAFERTLKIANKMTDPFEKAVYVMLMIAYIQPFVDGNKRTSRLTGNAVLLSGNTCPLSYRSINEIEYKKAVLLFYEQGNISYFKKLFLDQFEFVVKNYFL